MEDEKILKRVRHYLTADRQRQYEATVDDIKHMLEGYRRTSKGSAAIYRITSRADYQEGRKIKQEREILEKIKRKKRDKSDYDERSVSDYIGIRVVCVYPSDVAPTAAFIADKLHIHEAEINVPIDENVASLEKELQESLGSRGFTGKVVQRPNPRGYRALHLVVAAKGEDLKCEVQILTMLQETWAYKTHDTLYKNKFEEVLDEQRKQTRYLSDVLSAVDQQSELVKAQIEKDRRSDEQRRRGLMTQQLLLILSTPAALSEDEKGSYDRARVDFDKVASPEEGMRLLKLFIRERADKIRSLKGDSEGIELSKALLDHAQQYDVKFLPFDNSPGTELCKDVLRVVTLAAIINGEREFGSKVLDFAEKLVSCAERSRSQESIGRAWLMKGWLLFCMDRLEEAIQATEEAIQAGSHAGIPDLVHTARPNLAYYKAELAERTMAGRGGRLDTDAKKRRDECLELMREIRLTPRRKDTLGFIRIAFAENVEEVELGLTLCREALGEAPEKERELYELFFNLHKRKAYERTIDILNSLESR